MTLWLYISPLTANAILSSALVRGCAPLSMKRYFSVLTVLEFGILTNADNAQALVSKNLVQLVINKYKSRSFGLTCVFSNIVSASSAMLIVGLLLSDVW